MEIADFFSQWGQLKLCYNRLMLNRLILLISLAAAVVLTVMLNFTNPTEVGPLGVLVFFTAVYAIVFGVATWVIWLFRRTMGKKRGMRKKDYCYGMIMAFGPIMMLLMQSFGTLSPFTVLLVGLFIFLGCFLVSRRM